MKRKCLTLVVGLMLTAITAQASVINPWVQAKCDSMKNALYGTTATISGIHQIGFFPERGDATRRLPTEKIDLADFLIRNIANDEDGVLIGATSHRRIDPLHTQGSTTMDVTIQESIQLGRARFVNDATGRRCVVATQGIADDTTCVYLMIVRRAPGMPSLVPGRMTPVNLQGIRDTLNKLVQTTGNHERRIKALEDQPRSGIQPSDIGLAVFGGYNSFTLDNQLYNGPVVGLQYRYFDLCIEGFAGELFANTTTFENFGPEPMLAFKNNHLEGGNVWYAPKQGRDHPAWGKYYKIGVCGLHAQGDNLVNDSNRENYFAGAALSIGYPIWLITPEVYGTVGYSWTTLASKTPNTPPVLSQGIGTGLRLALVIGRR